MMYIRETYKFNFLSPMLLLMGSIFAIYDDWILSGILLLLGVAFLVSFQGIIIDIHELKMQKFNKILWFRFGKWVPLQPIQYLTITRYNLRGSQAGFLTGSEAGSTVSKSYKVNMVFEGKNLYVTLMHGSKAKMITEALKLGNSLECRVLDYTTHDKKWIL